MTPQQEAKELINKFCYEIATEGREDHYYTNVIHAKKCAIVAVNEILKVAFYANEEKIYNFYLDVKQELENS